MELEFELPENYSPELFDRVPEMGVEVWHWFQDGTHYFETRQMSDGILEANNEDLNASAGKRWGEGQRVASVPAVMFHDKLAEAVRAKDDAYIRKFLNNRDFRKLRTFGGRL